jgi:hypothetical protein
LPSNDDSFLVKPLLDSLRSKTSDSEFGYRVQALFAHVLGRLGYAIIEVNAHGHPDVKGRAGDIVLAAQVKSITHSSASTMFTLGEPDLVGIRQTAGYQGVLAALDCAAPVGWSVVRSERLDLHLNRPVHIATLRAEQDEQLSQDCTREFLDMVLMPNSKALELPFELLARRAMRGEFL